MVKVGVISHGVDDLSPIDLIGFDRLIAVDGALATFERLQIDPQLIVGDLDSIDDRLLRAYNGVPLRIAPKDKNYSDTEMALMIAYDEMEADQVVLFNFFGKRIDHSLYNLFLLKKFPELLLKNGKDTLFLLKGKIQLELPVDTLISLIPLSDEVAHVTTTGLKWNIKDKTVDKEFMSLSNVVVRSPVSIGARSGDLLVSYQLPQRLLSLT